MKKVYLLPFLCILLLSGCKSSILDDPSTTISFSVPQQGHVKLAVENSYNTVIKILVDEELSAGVHLVNFNENNLAEGVYFYTLEMRSSGSGNYSSRTRYFLMEK